MIQCIYYLRTYIVEAKALKQKFYHVKRIFSYSSRQCVKKKWNEIDEYLLVHFNFLQ